MRVTPRELVRVWWLLPVVGGALLLAAIYTLATSVHPTARTVRGTIDQYSSDGGQYQVKLRGSGFTTYTLSGDTAGAPATLAPGTEVRLSVMAGSDDVVALTAGATPPSATWTSPFFFSPDDWAAERRLPGLGLLGLGLVPLAVFGYFRFVRRDPSHELVNRHAHRLAGDNYGPRTAEVAALLRHLAALPPDDWELLGDACYRRLLEGLDLHVSVRTLEQAARSSRRKVGTSNARVAAEQLVRRHPPVIGTDGIDLRGSMVEAVGLAAGALALHDVLPEYDFDLLFGLIGRFVPLSALANAADPTTIVALP